MRMPRFTIREMMIAVAVAAICVWLVSRAIELALVLTVAAPFLFLAGLTVREILAVHLQRRSRPSPVRRMPRFRIRTLMICVLACALVLRILQATWENLDPLQQRTFSLVIIGIAASPFRFLGAWLGAPLGNAARHAFGWFAVVVACALGFLLDEYVEYPQYFVSYMRQGQYAAAVLVGMFAATIAEIAVSLFERARKKSSSRRQRLTASSLQLEDEDDERDNA